MPPPGLSGLIVVCSRVQGLLVPRRRCGRAGCRALKFLRCALGCSAFCSHGRQRLAPGAALAPSGRRCRVTQFIPGVPSTPATVLLSAGAARAYVAVARNKPVISAAIDITPANPPLCSPTLLLKIVSVLLSMFHIIFISRFSGGSGAVPSMKPDRFYVGNNPTYRRLLCGNISHVKLFVLYTL